MQPTELARIVANVCDEINCQYYVTGSLASSNYGAFRTTHDVDIVIELPSWHVIRFCSHFPAPDWYVDSESAMQAVRSDAMFNILHIPTGLKADVMPVKDNAFDECRLSRARPQTLPDGTQVMFAAPEDVILKKLEFYRDGRSEKHIRDITAMFIVSRDIIDIAYIRRWVLRTGVDAEWRHVCTLVNIAP